MEARRYDSRWGESCVNGVRRDCGGGGGDGGSGSARRRKGE